MNVLIYHFLTGILRIRSHVNAEVTAKITEQVITIANGLPEPTPVTNKTKSNNTFQIAPPE